MDPDGLTLIDTGLPGSGRKILNYISGLGRSPSDLKRIIITHSNIDHFGGLSEIKKASSARNLCQRNRIRSHVPRSLFATNQT